MSAGPHQLVHRLQEDERLDQPAALLARLARPLAEDAQLRDLLSGRWLGHPLHPPLTDVSIGAFTSATILDWLPGRWSHRSSDLLLAVGLLSSIPTAAAGLRDWSDTHGASRRLGTAHAMSNSLATLLYGWSLIKRARGRRGAAALLSLLGLTSLTVGGYLGGHLAYGHGVGVAGSSGSATD